MFWSWTLLLVKYHCYLFLSLDTKWLCTQNVSYYYNAIWKRCYIMNTCIQCVVYCISNVWVVQMLLWLTLDITETAEAHKVKSSLVVLIHAVLAASLQWQAKVGGQHHQQGKEMMEFVPCGRENENKFVDWQCTNFTSPCLVYYFRIKPAQLGETKTLGNIYVYVFPCVVLA